MTLIFETVACSFISFSIFFNLYVFIILAMDTDKMSMVGGDIIGKVSQVEELGQLSKHF